MEFIPEEAIKLLMAVLVGGLIGAEREFRDKVAGFRTIIFITIGATLITILSINVANDPARISANIVTGIGFLGAGAILRDGGKIAGLTTAAMIWLAAALGMGIGSGEYLLVGIATAITMVVLWIFPYFERWLDSIREAHTYEIILPTSSAKRQELEEAFQALSLRVYDHREIKSGENAVTTWKTRGKPRNHKKMAELLMADPEILEFRY